MFLFFLENVWNDVFSFSNHLARLQLFFNNVHFALKGDLVCSVTVINISQCIVQLFHRGHDSLYKQRIFQGVLQNLTVLFQYKPRSLNLRVTPNMLWFIPLELRIFWVIYEIQKIYYPLLAVVGVTGEPYFSAIISLPLRSVIIV